MGIGPNIKKYRAQLSLTQKDLADKLNVTYQAVSRWENDDVEPSIDTLKEMASLFNCSLDELLGSKPKAEVKEEPKVEPVVVQAPQPTVVEKVIIQEAKPVLAVCEHCNRPIYNPEEIRRITVRHRHGRTHHTSTKVICNECNEKRIQEEREAAKRAKEEKKRKYRKHRILGYVFGGLAAVLFVIAAIDAFTKSDSQTGYGCLASGLMAFTFISCIIMNNNCVSLIFLGISSWSVKFPGVIFSLDLDGILSLIAIKLLFAALGVIISILAFLFAIVVSAFVSVFIYPFALYNSYKCKDGLID